MSSLYVCPLIRARDLGPGEGQVPRDAGGGQGQRGTAGDALTEGGGTHASYITTTDICHGPRCCSYIIYHVAVLY